MARFDKLTVLNKTYSTGVVPVFYNADAIAVAATARKGE